MTESKKNLTVVPVVDKETHITCPKCTKTTRVTFQENSNLLDKLIVSYKCKCGHRGRIKLEKRVFLRKRVDLTGEIKKDGKLFGFVSIKDLSKSGLKFVANPRAKLQVGDNVEIEFRLDDKGISLIRQKGIIRNSNGLEYGFEFIKNYNNESDRRLGFYFF